MIRKSWTLGITVLLAAVLALPARALSYDAPITFINLANNTLTIGGKTFVVARNASIRLDGNNAALADLDAGMRATAEVARDNTTVLMINAHSAGPSLAGRVTGVDPGTDRVAIGSRTFWVPGNAEINLNGREAEVADLVPGMRVNAVLGTDGASIYRLYAYQRGAMPARISGTVVAVNNVRQTITIRTRKAGTQTVNVKDAMIDLDGRGAAVSEVTPGMTVVIRQWSPGVIYVKSRQLYARR